MSTDREEGSSRSAAERSEQSSDTVSLSRPGVEDADGVGLSMMLATGVLLALGYYGVVSIGEAGLGQVVPTPFYLLAVAVVFLGELSRARALDARGLARTAGVTAVYGTLVVLAIEGGGYLWAQPEAALDGFAGVTVLAVSLVVAALAYVLYLSTIDAVGRARVDSV